jgi:hypothetical protein
MDKKHGLHFMRGRCKKGRKKRREAHIVQPYLYREPQVLRIFLCAENKRLFFFSPVGLGDTFELVLFLSRTQGSHQYARDHEQQTISNLDGIRVRRTLGSVDKLVRETLCDRFHVAERRLAGLCTNANACENEVYTRAHGRRLHRWLGARPPGSLSAEGTRQRPDDGPYPANRYASNLLEDPC